MGNLPVLAPEYNHHPIGGEQVQQTLLARALAARGHRVSMVTADYGQPEGAQWSGVTVHKAYALGAGLPVIRFVHPRWTGVWSAMKRADADVYYVSCSGAIVGQVVMFCRRFGRKAIFRVASDADCARETLLMKYWRDKKLYEYGLRRAHVLVQSARQQELLARNYGVSSYLARMLVESSGASRPFASRDMPVLWVNNIRWLKRPDLFFELAGALPELRFYMAGGGVPGEMDFFERAARDARAHPNLSMLGRVPYHEAQALYGRARVLVNMSDIEGFPNSYLQAWAAGTPVVAFFDPDGLIAKEGLGYAVSSMEGMRNAVRKLATDEREWRAASERCHAFMAREYGEDAVLQPYIDALVS